MRIKIDFVAYTIVFCLIFALPLFSCAQNIADQKPVAIASAEVTKQTIKDEDPLIKEDDETDAPKKENKFFNFNSDSSPERKNQASEDKQDMTH